MLQKSEDAPSRLECAAGAEADPVYNLRLYVANGRPTSVRAIQNVKRMCESHLRGRYRLQVIDIYRHPEIAREDQILAVPTLIRKLPKPLRLFIGDLSDSARLQAQMI